MTIPNVARRAMAVGIVAVAFVSACGGNNGGPSEPSGDLSVTSIVPDFGLSGLATTVQINGSGFRSGLRVLVGGAEVQANIVNSSTMTAVFGTRPTGTYEVEVGPAFGRSVAAPGGFSYLPQISTIVVSGTLSLANVGDRSQLTATANFLGASPRDVTNFSRWSIANSSIASVSQTGLVTAIAIGATSVSATYPSTSSNQSRVGNALLSVTPAGTFVATGRTREPAAGNLVGVRVLNPASGRSVISNGSYSIAGLSDDRLTFTLDNYEPVEIRATHNGFDDVPMQRILRVITGGPTINSRIAPNDTSYDVGGGARCDPCKLVRITGGTGTVTVRLTWTAPSRLLSMWVNGVRIVASPGSQQLVTPITAGAEVIIYVGSTDGLGFEEHIPFAISAQ